MKVSYVYLAHNRLSSAISIRFTGDPFFFDMRLVVQIR